MTTQQEIDSLVEQVSELPEDAQVELLHSLVEMHGQHLGVYNVDDDEREALARSSEDVRLGRFATDQEINEMYARYGA